MKKSFVILIIAALSLAFVSCNKDEGSGGKSTSFTSISGTVENMPADAENYELKMFMGEEEIASCEVSADGKFSLDFPESVDEANLGSFIDNLGTDTSDITFVNPEAKVGMAVLELYGDGEYVDVLVYGSFVMTNVYLQATQASIVYSDSKCSAKGSMTEEEMTVNVDLSLKKGWNWFTMNMSLTEEAVSVTVVNKRPSNAKWHLGDDFDYFW